MPQHRAEGRECEVVGDDKIIVDARAQVVQRRFRDRNERRAAAGEADHRVDPAEASHDFGRRGDAVFGAQQIGFESERAFALHVVELRIDCSLRCGKPPRDDDDVRAP